MLVLSDKNVQQILHGLDKAECAQLLDTFSIWMTEYSAVPSNVYQPSRNRIVTSLGHTSLFMPASNTSTTGLKSMTIPGDGSTISGTVSICKPTGEIEGLLNARELTAFRTSLAANIIFSRREWQGKGDMVVFGAGKQAEWHIRIALLLGPAAGSIGKITVINRSQSSLHSFETRVFADLKQKHPDVDFRTICQEGNPAYDDEIKAALRTSLVIYGCTPSVQPLFPFEYLEKAQENHRRYISLIGSYKPHMQEVDKMTILSGKLLVVDSKEECSVEAGELIMGGVGKEQMTEIGELLPLDINDERIEILRTEDVVFKCVGMGIMDVAIGLGVMKLAQQKQIGITLEDF